MPPITSDISLPFKRYLAHVLQLFADACHFDLREFPWYHPWNTMLVFACLTSWEDNLELSVAPQREFGSFRHISAAPSRDSAPTTRSANRGGKPLHTIISASEAAQDALVATTDDLLGVINLRAPDGLPLEDGISCVSSATSAQTLEGSNYSDPSHDLIDTARTPDIAIFAHRLDGMKNTYSHPVLGVELKFPTDPTEGFAVGADASPRAKKFATTLIDRTTNQVTTQAHHIFEEYPLRLYPYFKHIRIWVGVGTYFCEYKFQRPAPPAEGRATPLPSFTKSKVRNIFKGNKDQGYSAAFKSSWQDVVDDARAGNL